MKNSKKGFTLVELLAVIVVLAIIMIIAVPSVMDSMNNARKGAFRVYAQKVLTTAETKHQATVLNGNDNVANYCTQLTTLMGENTGSYDGYAVVCGGNTDHTRYFVSIKDNNFSYDKKDYNSVSADPENASELTSVTCPSGNDLADYCSSAIGS